MRRFTSIFVITLSLLVAALSVNGQLTRGYISGTVQDPTGAVMPDVKVTITNTATNVKAEATSNGAGIYRFVAVEPGTYSVEFAKSGFETRRVANVLVPVSQEVTINQNMRIAEAATTVEVIEAPPGVELQKSSATMERRLDASVIQNIPLTGATRDLTRVALLAPTANRAPASNEVAANGQRARNNNFMLDGVDNNDLSVTLISNRMIPEAISEVQTQVQSFSAEYGRNSGAQLQAITISGTNAFHGELWDYYRGNWMEPLNLLNERAGLKATPRYSHNQAGGKIGGPVIKNKTFFFALYEANIRREAASAANSTTANIPTPTGFAALANLPLGDGQTTQSRQAALNGLSFLRTAHPLIANYTNVRNVTVNGANIQVGTINMPLSNPNDFHYYQGRADHSFSDNDRLTYRYLIDKRNQPDVVSNLQFGSLFSGAQTILGQNHAFSETHTFSPRLITETRFSYVKRNLNFPENDGVTPSTAITGLFSIGGLANFPQGRLSGVYQFQNVTTYLSGRHSLKFGADIRYNKLANIAGFDTKGTYTFDNLQDFVNSRPATFRQALSTASFDARQTNQFYFFQDDFKATKNLTFNFGLRYETSNSPFGFFGATDAQSLAVGIPPPAKRDNNNWAPRGGFAYSPSGTGGLSKALFGEGRTVFRGGYGIGYDVLFYNILTVNAANYPRVVNFDVGDRAALANQWPGLLTPPAGVTPPFDARLGYVNSQVDTQNPTVHFYNFSIQRQFARNVVLEVAYAGSRSYHGIRQGQLNPGILTAAQAQTVRTSLNANSIPGLPGTTVGNPASRRMVPAWGSHTTIESTAMARYDSFFVKLDKRLSHGLTAGGNFTYSANLSDNDESLGVGDITNWSPQIPQDYFNYRNEWSRSAFDVPARIAVYMVYNVPWFQDGMLGSTPMKHVFGGWSINGFTEAQSGQPFTIRTGVDTHGTGTAGPHRPSYNPAGTFTKDAITGDLRTFTTPINGTGIVNTFLGTNGLPLANSLAFPVPTDNLGRNTFRGPGDVRTAASFAKNIAVTERWAAILRVDFINAFNHRNFGNPVATMSSPVFGQNTLKDPGGRTMLASLKIRF